MSGDNSKSIPSFNVIFKRRNEMPKDKISGIYCIENMINHKKYIGLSKNISQRFSNHKTHLNGGYHINDHLQSAWNKYGEDNFKFYIIETCCEGELKEKEIYYIKKYQTKNRLYGYNQTMGGDGIRELSIECIDKMSLSETLYPVVQLSLNGQFIKTHRNCAKASIYLCGNTSLTENIRNCCDKKYGCKSISGYMWIYEKDYNSNEKYLYIKNKPLKEVDQYDQLGNFIKTYDSCSIAENETGISRKLISAVCHGNKRVAHGYIWRLHGEPFDKYETKSKVKTPVEQYDINNNFVRRYESQKEVNDILGINIESAIRGITKTAGGYIWKYAS